MLCKCQKLLLDLSLLILVFFYHSSFHLQLVFIKVDFFFFPLNINPVKPPTPQLQNQLHVQPELNHTPIFFQYLKNFNTYCIAIIL